jgi:hypothetical protein
MDLPPPFPTTDHLVECINHPVMGELVIKKIEAVNTRWKKQGRGKRREGGKEGEVEVLHLLTTPSNALDQKQLRG